MSFGSNNSRNIANLLRYEPLQPIQPRKGPTLPPPEPLLPQNQRQRAEIPIEEVFTPEEQEKRTYKRRTPMSSGGGGQNQLRLTSKEEDMQLEALKVRLDQIVRFYDERHNKLQTKLSVRLSELENFVMKEVPKVDSANIITADVIGCKQAIKELRRQFDHQSQQITTLKVMNDHKAAKQVSLSQESKEKQKMTVLFMEMVRLADTVEKMQNGMGNISKNYESKLQEIEYKIANQEKNLALISQRSLNGNEVLSQFGDKVMDRLQTAENNLAILGKERIKDKQTINQLISQNERIGEDVQGLVRNLQGEFQNKLDNRISETVSRLMYEHEERIAAQEEIKKNLDMRERISMEKQNSEKQEFRARYQNMDALVRTEFIKKQQSIRALHALLEEQTRNMQKQLLSEGNRRKQMEGILRTQIRRVQEGFRREYDIYKAHQSDLVEKIGSVVKEQIQVRLNSELNLKKLTSDIANQLVNDLNNVKQTLSQTSKKLHLSIKQVANQSSERSGQLSHYIDQQVKKVVQVVTEKYSKMKTVFTRLAQNLKNHLVNTEANRKSVEQRLSNIEDDFDKMKQQVEGQIEQFYRDLEKRLQEEKDYVETTVFKKNNDLTLRVNKLQQYTNQYFELLKGNIEDNKQILSKKLNNINEGKSPQSDEQMRELRGIVYDIKRLTEQMREESKEGLEDLRKEYKQANRDLRNSNSERQAEMNDKINKNSQSIKELQDNLAEITVKVNSLRTEAGTQNTLSNDRVKKLSDEIDAMNKKLKEVEEKTYDYCKQNEEDIVKLRADVAVLKGQVGALDDDIKKLSSS